MKPVGSLRLRGEDFSATANCLGWQVAQVISDADRACPGLRWYAADVETSGYQFPFRRSPWPVCIGSAELCIPYILQVDQFDSGVFAGVPSHIDTARFRDGGLWAEDQEQDDLGDALVEIRAFDTAYIVVSSSSLELLKALNKAQVKG